jgi:hypothetical protein
VGLARSISVILESLGILIVVAGVTGNWSGIAIP